MLLEKTGYSYNDITIVPSVISDVTSRSECNPYIKDKFLPIFTAPMASVVNEDNLIDFYDNGITPILPRNIDIKTRIEEMEDQTWVALSLNEFEDLFIKNFKNRIGDFRTAYFIVVDIANGHMKSLYDKCVLAKKLAKENGYKLTIMTGNIANAETYKWIYEYAIYDYEEDGNIYYECAIDFIRVGIGGGSGCITTSNVSIHYPQASLISECKRIKESTICKKYVRNKPAIVADGGIRNYDHVIKALALGADYVMIGSVFAQCIESAGVKIVKNTDAKMPFKLSINHYERFRFDSRGNGHGYYKESYWWQLLEPWRKDLNTAELAYGCGSKEYIDALKKMNERRNILKEEKYIGPIDVKFFGMASADGQKSISGEKTKTAEGITKWLPVKYTLKGWVENMVSYLCSAMSYTDCKTLNDFIGKPELIVNSISEIQAVNR